MSDNGGFTKGINMESLYFKTSSGIKSIVGRDLITDKFVALFELVKNSYDANAKNVIVSFNNIYPINGDSLFSEVNHFGKEDIKINSDSPHIIIADDGDGMNKDDLINKWLYLAYSEKQEGYRNKSRIFVGSKGIGRFSCDTLGELLHIRTKKCNERIEHNLYINWADFETSLDNEFGKIKISYDTCQINNKSKYTILTIGKPRYMLWAADDEQKRAKKNLSRLMNPFIDDNAFNIYLGQNISIKNPNPETKIHNNITSVLKDKTTTVELKLDDKIHIKLIDRGELIYEASKQNETELQDTPINISINYLNTSAKNHFKRLMKVPAVRYGNIFIYKNGFRVMPYGEEDFDLFGLNLRKTQGYNRYLGTREIIGFISIQDKLHVFKETSSRNNGFIENTYFNTLKEIYFEYVHRILERYISLIKWGENIETGEEIYLDESINQDEIQKFKKFISSTKNFEVSYFKQNLNIDNNNPEKQLTKILDKVNDKEIKRDIIQVKQQVNQLKQENKDKGKILATKDKEIDHLQKQNENLSKQRESSSYSEQISHHFKTIAEDLYFTTESLIEIVSNIENKELKEKALIEIGYIRNTQIELIAFRELLINTNLDLRSEQIINWYQQAKLYERNRSKQNYGLKVTCSISNNEFLSNWQVECDVIQYQIALDNFYQNAREQNGKYLDILFEENKIIFSSDSNKIDDIHLPNIFNLGYTTKPNGTGIGLNQIYNFFYKKQFDIYVNQEKNIVRFVIEKRKE